MTAKSLPMRYLLVHTPNAKEVEAYLPNNYEVIDSDDEDTIVAGRDFSGWTLDGYVIPRLQSGWIQSEELVGVHRDIDPAIKEVN